MHMTKGSARVPIWTLLLLALVAALHLYPLSFEVLVYHRHKILAGEWWRVLTGHLLHGSSEHVIRDGASFLFFGALLEHRLAGAYLPYLFWAALAISLNYLFFMPGVLKYVGLSGIITGMCGYLLLQELPRTWKERRKLLFAFYVIMTSILVFKVSYEFLSGGPFFYRSSSMKAAPEAHVVGLVSGILAWGIHRLVRKEETLPKVPQSSVWLAMVGGVTWLGMVLFW